MAAMLPTGGGSARTANPYEAYDNPVDEDDLIDPDDGEECLEMDVYRRTSDNMSQQLWMTWTIQSTNPTELL